MSTTGLVSNSEPITRRHSFNGAQPTTSVGSAVRIPLQRATVTVSSSSAPLTKKPKATVVVPKAVSAPPSPPQPVASAPTVFKANTAQKPTTPPQSAINSEDEESSPSAAGEDEECSTSGTGPAQRESFSSRYPKAMIVEGDRGLAALAKQNLRFHSLILAVALAILALGLLGRTQKGLRTLFLGSKPFALTTLSIGIIATLYTCYQTRASYKATSSRARLLRNDSF